MALNTPALEIAKTLRKQLTPAEHILWQALRNKALGEKFRRQMPFVFGDYHFVADFCCVRKKIVIELDGGVHNSSDVKDYDRLRDKIFSEEGYKVLRIKNKEIDNNLNKVLLKIQEHL
ncbi:endonuclease domain-containing protein [Candidatus Falkowbacteria bacterium]|nr:endonuclease domain-containing protein [Candidatus Falkowbacteria bacterium]